MRPLNIPSPPDPASPQFSGNPIAWQRATAQWMQQAKGLLENAHNEVIRPCGQQMRSSGYVVNTVATGTTTGTDLSNVVATLIDTLTAKGILSPTITRNSG